VNICRPLTFRETGDLLAQKGPMLVGVTVPGVLEVIVRREANSDAFRPDGVANCCNDLQHELATILNGTSVLVCPLVDIVVKELVQQIPIRTVDFDSVKPSLIDGPLRGCSPFRSQAVNFVHGQRSRRALRTRGSV
jgi:hypothetical protein